MKLTKKKYRLIVKLFKLLADEMHYTHKHFGELEDEVEKIKKKLKKKS